MARIKEYRAARDSLEGAIAALIHTARRFSGDGNGSTHRELLRDGREYGRALNRVERMRGKR